MAKYASLSTNYRVGMSELLIAVIVIVAIITATFLFPSTSLLLEYFAGLLVLVWVVRLIAELLRRSRRNQ